MNDFANTWFFNNEWKPYAFQEQTWKAIAQQKSGLLNAPTGFGKTYAIWFGILQQYYQKKEKKSKKLHALWISPLRALSKEIQRATQQVSDHLDLDYRVELRTGDTSASVRQKQKTNTPHALITTPESVQLLLSSKGYSDFFSGLEFVVVDEWHELLGSKRGTLVELALSRLKNINPNLKIWGISATIGNLDEAMHILLGSNKGVLIKAALKKKIHIETLLPNTLEKYPQAGHLGVKMIDKVFPVIDQHHSTLLFTNTRSQAEIWYHQLLEKFPELAGQIALHHGSLSEETRLWVEEALHAGRLKAVVCTSSLDLGVDFRPVDCVVQIGSPKGVARFMQRAGRSGHQPDAISKIYFLPTHSLEIMEGAALHYAVSHSMYEQRQPYIRCFDILVQYMVTLAVSEGFRAEELFNEIIATHCFGSITKEEFNDCLLMITQGGRSLEAYDEFHKVIVEDGLYKVTDKYIAMRHRLSMGAIVSDAMMQVRYMKGSYLGSIEESFISKLKQGDAFWFGGKLLELVKTNAMQAIVKSSKQKKGIVPSWMGGRFAISTDFATALRHTFQMIHSRSKDKIRELNFLQPLFSLQEQVSAIPKENELLVEYIKTKFGHHLFVFPFDGKLIHEGMAALTAFRLSKIKKASFSIASNEYGFELLSETEYDIDAAIQNGLFSDIQLFEDIEKGINISEMARRKFRDIAGIAGLVFQGYPGKPVKTNHLQANSGLFFKVFEEYEPDNLLLREAYDEVFTFQLDYARMRQVYQRVSQHKIILRFPERLTPFSFPVFAESFRERYSNEDWESRLEKLKQQLL
ncbi:MAG: ligase-associated DNA damage response DEXH box helicase [Arachidicoccus sp.]|nr:ligase-associated DNA damage response DEXH box helicase [Arachidicoccus sp.]